MNKTWKWRERYKAFRERMLERFDARVKRNRLLGLRVLQPLIIVTVIAFAIFTWYFTLTWLVEYLPHIAEPQIAIVLCMMYVGLACTFTYVFEEIVRTNILKGW